MSNSFLNLFADMIAVAGKDYKITANVLNSELHKLND